jgi:hypothetical protein
MNFNHIWLSTILKNTESKNCICFQYSIVVVLIVAIITEEGTREQGTLVLSLNLS